MKTAAVDGINPVGASQTVLSVVLYHSDHCVPCRNLESVFAQAASCREQLRFVSCDVDAERERAADQKIANLPTIVVYAAGREQARISGSMRLSALLDWIDFHVTANVAQG